MLSQPLERAQAGEAVTFTTDIIFAGWEEDGTLTFQIERGHLGSTQVEFFTYEDGEPVLLETIAWGGIMDGPNVATIEVPAATLFGATP